MGWFFFYHLSYLKIILTSFLPKNVKEGKIALRKHFIWLPSHLLVLLPETQCSSGKLEVKRFSKVLFPPTVHLFTGRTSE